LHVDAAEIEARLAHLRLRRKQQARARMLRRLALGAVGVLALVLVAATFVYAGSPDRLAEGVRVAGVDVGGLSAPEAEQLLRRRAAAVAPVPLVVRAGGRTYRVRAGQVGLVFDWPAAVDEAEAKGDGIRPIRGLRRFAARTFGADVEPLVRVDERRLDRVLRRLERVNIPHRDAAVRLRGVQPVLVEARPGRVVDRPAARRAILAAFASLERQQVVLSLRTDEPRVTAEMLQPALQQTQRAVSAPVRLRLAEATYRVPRWRIAQILELPANGTRTLRIGGPDAEAYFKRLSGAVNTQARDAEFVVVSGGRVLIKPSVDARVLDVPRTAEKLLAAALSPVRRVAPLVVATKPPDRTTADAKRMGITGVVSSYTTTYGGDPNRIHNVQLVSRLIDDTLIPPGHTFSFNGTTGERNEAKGFLTAPVIINGELQTALGGGVCQVSTTVFNAAYEAGLPITERTNHYLYISHYPQGRDATVNYPDLDLKFVNDTGRWLLLRAFVGASSLTVNLYGTPQNRRVESEVAPLRETGPAPVKLVKDPTLTKGKRVVEDPGSSSLATSVRRRVYGANGNVLYDNVWYSSYRGEKRIVRVGTKPKPKKAEQPAQKEAQPPPTDGPGT
jgi:vancomycin resistance protein YoaR